MNKKMFYGWREVCGFAYVQTMKSKAMKITMVILCVLMLCVFPVISMFVQGNEKEETSITNVYLYGDNEEILNAYVSGDILQGSIYEDVTITPISKEEVEKKTAELKKAKGESTDILMEILCDEDVESMNYGVEFRALYGEKSKIGKSDASGFASYLEENMKKVLLENAGLEKETIEQLLIKTEYKLQTIDKSGAVSTDDSGLDSMEYGLTYGYLMVVMFAVIIAGSKVAELIVTEKTSKVIEYLLTSIETLALLLGKVISTMLIVFTLLAMLGVSLFASLGINMAISGSDSLIPSYLTDMVSGGTINGLTPANVAIAIFMILLGFLFYGFIAGLAGATVGKIEELAEGLKLFTFAEVIGVYLVLALVMMSAGGSSAGGFGLFVYYMPLSSMFVVPVYLLIGKITLSTALISLAILFVSTILIWIFVTKVFENVLYNNGSVVKLKELIAIYKESRKEKGGKK